MCKLYKMTVMQGLSLRFTSITVRSIHTQNCTKDNTILKWSLNLVRLFAGGNNSSGCHVGASRKNGRLLRDNRFLLVENSNRGFIISLSDNLSLGGNINSRFISDNLFLDGNNSRFISFNNWS
jgi:hypothetical protein